MTMKLRNTPKQRRSEMTLAALTAASRTAADLIGYDRFTTADVASIAGCSIGTVYRYFPDRIALLDAIDSGRQVAADVRAERARQDAKWGEQNHPDGSGRNTRPLAGSYDDYAVDGENYADEIAMWARSECQLAAEDGQATWSRILIEEVFEALAESDPAMLRTELVQVAAVAQQWVEAIDRRNNR